MTLLALGINHKTAPVALRERVTFSPETLDKALESLLAQPMVQGGVVLSTCNRTELYLSVEEQDNLQEALIRWLCDYHQISEEELRKLHATHHRTVQDLPIAQSLQDLKQNCSVVLQLDTRKY